MKYLPLLLLLCGCTNTGVNITRQSIVPYIINGAVVYGTNIHNAEFDRASLAQKIAFSGLEIGTNGTVKIGGYANDGGAAVLNAIEANLKAATELLKTIRPTP